MVALASWRNHVEVDDVESEAETEENYACGFLASTCAPAISDADVSVSAVALSCNSVCNHGVATAISGDATAYQY